MIGERARWLMAVASCAVLVIGWYEAPQLTAAQTTPQVESGVYGFSGAGARFSEPEGVIGECIWIFDATNRIQMAKAECTQRAPGKFRLVLPPGRYVLHGPGGLKPIAINPGGWVRVDSIALLPMAP